MSCGFKTKVYYLDSYTNKYKVLTDCHIDFDAGFNIKLSTYRDIQLLNRFDLTFVSKYIGKIVDDCLYLQCSKWTILLMCIDDDKAVIYSR